MINVVAGLIEKDGKYFIARRTTGNEEVLNKWEFPGGKIEEGEDPKKALEREMMEEFELEIVAGDYIDHVVYEYPTKTVDLQFYNAKVVGEEIRMHIDHSDYRFISLDEINNYKFAPADQVFIDKLKGTIF
jgi:8-oxo-dGTP diphosphatase